MQQSADNFEQCLNNFLSYYDLDVDVSGVAKSISFSEDESLAQRSKKLLDYLGFKAHVSTVKGKAIEKIGAPVILDLGNGELALYVPRKTHGQKLYRFAANDKSEKGEAYQSKVDLKKFSGEAVHVTDTISPIASDTEHMKSGHVFDWFWSPIFRHWTKYFDILVSSFFINVLMLAIPLYTLNVYDRVIVNFSHETLFVLTLGVFIALFFDFVFKVSRAYLLEKVAEDVGSEFDFNLMERLFRIKALDLPMSLGEKANLFKELQGIKDFYAARLAPSAVDLPFVLLFVGVIYSIAPPLAFVPIGAVVVIIAVNIFMYVPISRITKQYFSTSQVKQAVLIDTLAGIQTIKMFNAIGGKLLNWDMNVKGTAEVSRKNNFLAALASNISMFVAQLSHITVVFLGVYQIEQELLTVGGLIACTILASRALGPVINFSNVLSRLKQMNDVLKVIDKFYNIEYEDAEDMRRSPKAPYQGRIELLQVNHQYPQQERLALSGVQMTLEKGDRVGIIGKTGAGKSTLSKIIAGVMTPAKGEVRLDGYKYTSIPSSELQRTISYVPQDPFFFRGSIRHNIMMGREHISNELLERAIDISGLDLVIQQTGEGLDTDVGELGHRLSGGQKQAIALARAIVQEPRVLVFDEPTNGMDSALENRVLQRLTQYVKDKTFVMVTHRTTLLALVNRLVLMDSGRVIADGARDDILRKMNAKIDA